MNRVNGNFKNSVVQFKIHLIFVHKNCYQFKMIYSKRSSTSHCLTSVQGDKNFGSFLLFEQLSTLSPKLYDFIVQTSI